ncbi:membrane-bound ClpP family serine protease [Microbacterium testaceum]|uniref:hypothetical protein n=1 Tax=Microbacterium TaxID=33882 RepID=UPI002786585F|nr:hypothetical protein [Microbacterium testaceum]MDQ1172746.1 membrane-bound ClpP family serine protease [Microbacterium testaceum]
MNSLSRLLGVLSLLLAIAAVAVPVVGVAVLLLAGSGTVVAQAVGTGLAIAAVGVVLAVIGFFVGRRGQATAMPVVGGLTSACVAAGILIALPFV